MHKQFSIRTRQLLLSVALAVTAASAWAGPKTVTLDVPGMTCAACPITVKMSLTKVDGVTKASVVYDKREAIVTFDDSKTNTAALTKATADAGYPSTVKK